MIGRMLISARGKMMDILWLSLVAGLGAVQKLLQKKYSNNTCSFRSAGAIYTWIMAIASTGYFAAMAKFSLMPNGATVILATVYAFVVIASLIYTNFVFQKMSIAKVTLFSSGGALTVPYVFDVIFLDGDITVKKTVAVVLLMTVFVLPLLDRDERDKGSRSEIFFGSVTFALAGMSTVVSKLFTVYSDGVKSETFCFWTNLIMIPLLAAKLLFGNEKKSFLSDVKAIGLKYGWISAVVGFISAVGTPITFRMIDKMNVTVYTIASNSLNLIFATVVSAAIFRERTDKRTVIGLLAAIGAIVLNSV